MYKISQYPDAQEQLRKELSSIKSPATESAEALPDPRELADLPFLNAVIYEGLRLRNNLPESGPRVTPGHADIGSLRGLPRGIRVGAYTWSLHHDETVFPRAETWDPSRWIEAGSKNQNLNKYMYTFGRGSRGCVGEQLAMERKCARLLALLSLLTTIVIRYAVAAIYTNYRTLVADESDYPGDEGFVGGDGREKLFLRFEPVAGSGE